MKRLSKREYEVIALYSKGLTFKEIGYALNINIRTAINYYMRVKTKDKSRVTRAKHSRDINKTELGLMIEVVVIEAKQYNKFFAGYNDNLTNLNERFFQARPLLCIKDVVRVVRMEYIKQCLVFTFNSFNRWKVNLTKKRTMKVAT
ncbi:LuxR C-terminal-related transcriptional regulator [Sulfurimonas sp.]|nr:LuxR C-terminal-related transcriptional regulator [Sulfurimonas sp.]